MVIKKVKRTKMTAKRSKSGNTATIRTKAKGRRATKKTIDL